MVLPANCYSTCDNENKTIENEINVTAYQDGSAYYIDMTSFPLDQNRISNPSKGSFRFQQ